MDMLSLCRKHTGNVSSQAKESTRRSPRLAELQNTWGSSDVQNKNSNTGAGSSVASSGSLPAISEDKDGNIMLRILAKPGAKQSKLADMQEDCIVVQVGAPARERQANYELVCYLGKILQLRKGDISVVKGLRSKIKSVEIVETGLTTENVRDLLMQEITRNAVRQ